MEKEWKQIIVSKEIAQKFSIVITEKIKQNKNSDDPSTDTCGEFAKKCNTAVILIYTTRSESKAAFAERTMRS